MPLNSNRSALQSQNLVWSIDSANFTGNLNPLNLIGTQWFLTLTAPKRIDDLLDDINNTDGWVKVKRVAFCWYE